MAGREDFGILRSEMLADRRAHHAAELLVRCGLATEATAFATICGIMPLLGIWAMRDTDDGVLPDDAVLAVKLATVTTHKDAAQIVTALREAKLLRDAPNGLYLVGFKDCYQPIIDRRMADRDRKRLDREESAQDRLERAEKLRLRKASIGHPADVQPTSGGHPSVPSVPCRAVPAVPSASERNGTAGSGSENSHPAVSVGAALASEAAAAPTSAGAVERNGTTAAPLKYPRCTRHAMLLPCTQCDFAKRRLEGGTTPSATADIASRVKAQINHLAAAATPPAVEAPKSRLEPPPDDAERRKLIRETFGDAPS